MFSNNTDSGESARNEPSHLKSALLARLSYRNIQKLLLHEKWELPDFENGRDYFKRFGAERNIVKAKSNDENIFF